MCTVISLKDLVFSCAFLFAFFLFARISNLAPASVGSFDPKKHLCRGDIVVTSFGLLVSFKWSKTNQTGAKPLTIPSLSISDSYLCPVRAYLLMCSRLPAPAEAPAFFTAYHSDLTPLLPSHSLFRFLGIVCRARIGVSNPSWFRGHSFRRGGATWAFQNGVPGEFLQIYGGWASDAYKSYLEFSDDAKLQVARDMVRALPGVLDA